MKDFNDNENLFVKIKEPKTDGGRSQMTKWKPAKWPNCV